MISRVLVDALDLQQWADRRDAQSGLPGLVRRLALASSNGVLRCDFPTGEGVQQPGWDGIIEAEASTTYVPEGASGWELSTSKDIGAKANSDFRSRSEDPLGLEPGSTTFVAVTLRAWRDKRDWLENRRQEGIWHDVRAYDAYDLEAWLQETPPAHLYISNLLGKQPMGVSDSETYWSTWVSATDPATPSGLVLAGRENAVQAIQNWLQSGEPEIAVRAETREEALSVVLASVRSLPNGIADTIFARTIIVDDPTIWHSFEASQSGLVLVANFERGASLSISGKSQNRVVVLLSHSDRDDPSAVDVARLSSERASEILMEAGFDRDTARELALRARHSLMAFRRSIARTRLASDPRWSSPEVARQLVPLLLAGTWDDTEEGDREQLEALAGTDYDNVTNIAIRWANEPDPPLRRIGSVWTIASKEDAWEHLFRYLVADDLARLEVSVETVLGTADPRYDLEPDKRWKAAIMGKKSRHSRDLRRGLAETLALIGSWREQILGETDLDVGQAADSIVGRLLGRANVEAQLWASLSSLLPLLAESSPDVFLTAVEDGINSEPSAVIGLFSEEGNPMFTTSPHTGLLWALEVVSWSSERLGRASNILAILARLDPGGRLANRPSRSLRAIFLPWLPQTSANLNARLRVLDQLRATESAVAWDLMLELLPQHHGVGTFTARPEWRNWQSEPDPDRIPPDYPVAIREISERLLKDARVDATRLPALVGRFANFSEDHREEIVSILSEVPVGDISEGLGLEIWSELRRFISRHRSYPDAQWSIQEEWLDRLANVHRRFEPEDPLRKVEWLFASDPRLLEGTGGDWRGNLQEIERSRKEAVTEFYSLAGLEGILELASRSERPDAVGFSLGSAELITDADGFLQDYLASSDDVIGKVAKGFVLGRIAERGSEWAVGTAERLRSTLANVQLAVLLTSLPPDEATFEVVDQQEADAQDAYWGSMQIYGIGDDLVNIAARRLIDHGRPYSGLDMMGFSAHDPEQLDHELVAEALEVALETPVENDYPMTTFGYHIAELLTMISMGGKVDESRLAGLEWAYLPVIGSRDRTPVILHRELARNPAFFVEVICLVYRAEGEEPRTLSEDDQVRANNAYRLLESWKTIPSTQDGGELDQTALEDWVTRARELSREQGRLAIGDENIGTVLSAAPAGEDGSWPHEAVRVVIENITSNEIERGLELGVFNSRGVTSRGPFEGGDQERQLAARYNHDAESLADQYPRTASVLRRLAQTYTRMATREDIDAELREDLGR